jgi:high-affinity nickel-transport protein
MSTTIVGSPFRGNLRRRVVGIYGVLAVITIAAWAWALVAFHAQPVLLSLGLLAYSFGLRHAVDADHIAAIDNVTRKLMQEGKRPVTIGFFFALGHSTVVLLLVAAIAATAAALQGRLESWRTVGDVVSTSVSALFLFLLAAMNIIILRDVWQAFRRVRDSGGAEAADADWLLTNRGLLGRTFRPLFRLIEASWQMFPVGFLFGLGFDTATQVSLLGVSAAEASKGVSIWSVMVFPVLFAAGMMLVDTTDGVVMLGAYHWAFVRPIRKLYYNLTITVVSVMVAILIGGVEALGLLVDQLGLKGPVWDFIDTLNDNFNNIGFGIIGLFVASWLVSILIYRIKGYDKLEAGT